MSRILFRNSKQRRKHQRHSLKTAHGMLVIFEETLLAISNKELTLGEALAQTHKAKNEMESLTNRG